jgi:hypothetical protein
VKASTEFVFLKQLLNLCVDFLLTMSGEFVVYLCLRCAYCVLQLAT